MKKSLSLIALSLLVSLGSFAQRNVYVVTQRYNQDGKTHIDYVAPNIIANPKQLDFDGKTLTETASGKTFCLDTVKAVTFTDKGYALDGLVPEDKKARYFQEMPFISNYKSIVTTAETSPTNSTDAKYDDFVENSTFDKQLKITFNGETAVADKNIDYVSVTIDGAHVTILSGVPGLEIELTGETTNGSLTLLNGDLEEQQHKAKILLNGVKLSNPSGEAIKINSKKRTYIVLADNTANSLSDGVKPDTQKNKACLFSKGKLSFSGKGYLKVKSNYKHAILSEKDLHIIDGILDIESGSANKGSAFKSEDDITIGGGYLQAVSWGNAGKGVVADSLITISGGEVYAFTHGDAYLEVDPVTSIEDYTSSTAIKCDSTLFILGGKIGAQSTGVGGKAISSGYNMTIENAEILASTYGVRVPFYKISNNDNRPSASPKGIKTAGCMKINSGKITVKVVGGNCAEGLEAKKKEDWKQGKYGKYDNGKLYINDGDISLFCVDDAVSLESGFTMKKGSLFGISLTNDGLDAPSYEFNGGDIYVIAGPETMSAIDSDNGNVNFNGGTLRCVGGQLCGNSKYNSTKNSINFLLRDVYEYVIIRDAATDSNLIKMELPKGYRVHGDNNFGNYAYGVMIGDPALVKDQSYKIIGVNNGVETELYQYTQVVVNKELYSKK